VRESGADKCHETTGFRRCILDAFAQQFESLLGDLRAQHEAWVNRRAVAMISFRVARRQRRHQRRPRHGGIDFRQEHSLGANFLLLANSAPEKPVCFIVRINKTRYVIVPAWQARRCELRNKSTVPQAVEYS
jgi:hypothetical protein